MVDSIIDVAGPSIFNKLKVMSDLQEKIDDPSLEEKEKNVLRARLSRVRANFIAERDALKL